MSNQQNDQLVEMISEHIPCECGDCLNRRLITAQEKIEELNTSHRSEKYGLQSRIECLRETSERLKNESSEQVIRIANQDRLLKERETQFVTIEADYFKRYPARNQKLVDEVAELHRRIAGFNSRDEDFQVVIRDNKKYIKILETNLKKTRDELASLQQPGSFFSVTNDLRNQLGRRDQELTKLRDEEKRRQVATLEGSLGLRTSTFTSPYEKKLEECNTLITSLRDQLAEMETYRNNAVQHQEETARVNDKLQERIEHLGNIFENRAFSTKNLISRIEDLMKLNAKKRKIIKSASITSQETISKLQSEVATLKAEVERFRTQPIPGLPAFPNVDELFDQFFQTKSCKESETKSNEAMRRSGKTRG
jgi:chromosome segregation ATPase